MDTSTYIRASQQPSLSPDGTHVAVTVDDTLQIRRISTLELVWSGALPSGSKGTLSMAWAPVSKTTGVSNRFLISTSEIIKTYDLHHPEWSASIQNNGKVAHVEFGCDDEEIMAFSTFKILTVWNLHTGKGVEVKDVKCIKCHSRSIGATPTLAILTRSGATDTISLYRAGMNMVRSFETKTVDAQGLKWSPDGRWLAVWDTPAMGYKVLIYTADGHLYRSYTGDYFQDELKGLGVKSIEWSPKGDFLAVAGYEKTIALLSTKTFSVAARFGHPKTANPEKADIFREQTTPSRCYVKVDQRVTPPGAAITDSPIPKIGSSILRFSTDGSLLATREDSMPTAVWIWDLGKLECVAVLLQHDVVRRVLWHPTDPTSLLVQCSGETNVLYSWSASESTPRVLDMNAPSGKAEAQWVPNQAHRNPVVMLCTAEGFLFAYPEGKDVSPVPSIREMEAMEGSDDSLYEILSPNKQADMEENLYTADGFLDDTFEYRGQLRAGH